jgi:hypothetical protein
VSLFFPHATHSQGSTPQSTLERNPTVSISYRIPWRLFRRRTVCIWFYRFLYMIATDLQLVSFVSSCLSALPSSRLYFRIHCPTTKNISNSLHSLLLIIHRIVYYITLLRQGNFILDVCINWLRRSYPISSQNTLLQYPSLFTHP